MVDLAIIATDNAFLVYFTNFFKELMVPGTFVKHC